MTLTEPQIIRTEGGEELVVIPRARYEALLAETETDEDRADAALYRARKAALEEGRAGRLPAEVGAALLKGDRLLKALRRWRGLTQTDLAAAAGLTQGYLSEIESGAKPGSDEAFDKIALALDVPRAWMD